MRNFQRLNVGKLRDGIVRVIDFFYFPFLRRWIPCGLFRYGFCGAANVGLDLLLYFITFHYVLNETDIDLECVTVSAPVAALIIVFPITFLTGFWLARSITFQRSSLRGGTQLFRYLVTTGAAFLVNYFGLKLLVGWGIYPTPSRAIVAVFAVALSFFLNKQFSFRGCEMGGPQK